MSYVQRKLPHQMNGLSVVKMEEFELGGSISIYPVLLYSCFYSVTGITLYSGLLSYKGLRIQYFQLTIAFCVALYLEATHNVTDTGICGTCD